MALDKTILGALITSKINALSDSDKLLQPKVMEAMADAIITHFTTAGVINTNVSTTLAGTAPGPSFPSTVTGTGTGTGVGTIS